MRIFLQDLIYDLQNARNLLDLTQSARDQDTTTAIINAVASILDLCIFDVNNMIESNNPDTSQTPHKPQRATITLHCTNNH